MAAYPMLALGVLAFILGVAVSSMTLFRRHHADTAGVNGSRLLGAGIRSWYFSQLEPFEDWCVEHGIPPATLTYAQLAGSTVVTYCYAKGLLFVGGWLLLVIGSLDIVDGRVARRTDGGSASGAYLDSVVDRYADCLAFIGLAVYFRESWVLWVVLLALLGTNMVSYTRARAEALGVECKVGLFQRPERTVVLGLGSMFAVIAEHLVGPWWGEQHHSLLVLVLLTMAALTNLGAVQRFRHVQGALAKVAT